MCELFRLKFSNMLPFSRRFCSRFIHNQKNLFHSLDSRHVCQAVICEQYGDPRKVLTMRETDTPSIKNNQEVLIKMLMAPINPSDINTIEGTYYLKPPLPAVVGNEGVGEVLDVGSSVKDLAVGDWVIPRDSGFGTWRTHALAKEDDLQKVPKDLPPLSLATFAVNACTAYRMLKDFENLEPGDVILQNSANSAVGQNVIQLASYYGYVTVNIVRNRPDIDNLVRFLNDMGADFVFTEEYCRSVQMKDLINSLKKKPKLALNGVGGKSATELLRYLDSNGSLVTYGGMSKKPIVIPTGVSIFKQIKVLGYWNSLWNKMHGGSEEQAQMFSDLFETIRRCKLLPPISHLVDLTDYNEAVSQSMEGFIGQKNVFVMEEDFKN